MNPRFLLLPFLTLLIIFTPPVEAGNTCCEPSRIGFVEFQLLVDYLNDPKTIDAHFSYDNVTDIYSIDKKSVLEFKNNHYFWDDHYEPLDNRTKVCTFKLSRHQEEIEHVIFPDGSHPTQVVFGCKSDQECCEVGCCAIYKYFYFWFMYPACTLLIILGYMAREKRERVAAREERMRRILRR